MLEILELSNNIILHRQIIIVKFKDFFVLCAVPNTGYNEYAGSGERGWGEREGGGNNHEPHAQRTEVKRSAI